MNLQEIQKLIRSNKILVDRNELYKDSMISVFNTKDDER